VKKRRVIINAEKFKNGMVVWDNVLPFSHKGLDSCLLFSLS